MPPRRFLPKLKNWLVISFEFLATFLAGFFENAVPDIMWSKLSVLDPLRFIVYVIDER